jgi:hypothetical protein
MDQMVLDIHTTKAANKTMESELTAFKTAYANLKKDYDELSHTSTNKINGTLYKLFAAICCSMDCYIRFTYFVYFHVVLESDLSAYDVIKTKELALVRAQAQVRFSVSFPLFND